MDKGEADAIQDDIISVMNIAMGGTYLPIALALALIDKGTIDAGRLRDIIASLRAIQAYDFELAEGQLEDAEMGMNRMDDFLTGWSWKPGQVVEQLRVFEASEQASSQLRQIVTAKKPKP